MNEQHMLLRSMIKQFPIRDVFLSPAVNRKVYVITELMGIHTLIYLLT